MKYTVIFSHAATATFSSAA